MSSQWSNSLFGPQIVVLDHSRAWEQMCETIEVAFVSIKDFKFQVELLFYFPIILHLDYWFIPLHHQKWIILMKKRNVIFFAHSDAFLKELLSPDIPISHTVINWLRIFQLESNTTKPDSVFSLKNWENKITEKKKCHLKKFNQFCSLLFSLFYPKIFNSFQVYQELYVPTLNKIVL